MNKQLFKRFDKDSGMSVTAIAKKSGMVRETLITKLNRGISTFEILLLSRALQ